MELIRIRPSQEEIPPGNIVIDNQNIIFKPKVRILDMHIQNDSKVATTLYKLKKTTHHLAGVIQRITRTRKGVREEDTVELATFVASVMFLFFRNDLHLLL